jgi:hypothetical protein
MSATCQNRESHFFCSPIVTFSVLFFSGKLGRFGNQGVMGGHPNMGNNNMGSSRGGGLFSKAVGGLVLERLGIRADDLIGALPVIPQQLLDPTIVPKKAYFYEHDDRGDDDGWDGGFRGGFRKSTIYAFH